MKVGSDIDSTMSSPHPGKSLGASTGKMDVPIGPPADTGPDDIYGKQTEDLGESMSGAKGTISTPMHQIPGAGKVMPA